MKKFVLLIAVVFILPLFILSCDDNNSGNNNSMALTENDFAQDLGMRADPESGVVATFLEPPESEMTLNDTDEIGVDKVPYTYSQTLEHTFCWQDDDLEAEHLLELKDSSGATVHSVVANGECVTSVVEPGEYEAVLTHDGREETTHPIFMVPQNIDANQSKKHDSFVQELFQLLYSAIINLDSGYTQTTHARHTIEKNVLTLIVTRDCFGCDLRGANLEFAPLEAVNLVTANLEKANLQNADLTDAMLNLSKLSEADFSMATMVNTCFSFAVLIKTDMKNSNLTKASIVSANASEADFSGADLTEANLTSSILVGADFSGAILDKALWCNFCICEEGSIGMCKGCSPPDTCKSI